MSNIKCRISKTDHSTLDIRHLVSHAPGVTRTPGQRFRKPLLYPPELQGQVRGRKRRNVRELGVVQQGLDASSLQSLAALEEVELDQKTESRDAGPGPADKLRSGVGCPTGGQHVIHDQHAIARLHGV